MYRPQKEMGPYELTRVADEEDVKARPQRRTARVSRWVDAEDGSEPLPTEARTLCATISYWSAAT